MTPGGVIARRAKRITIGALSLRPGEVSKMRLRSHLLVVLAVVVVAAGLSVPAASASGISLLPSCGAKTYPFKAWGDNDAYCSFPNLGFESGKTAWTVTGSGSVVSGNEPWHVSGAGTHTLQLGPGATALSASLPVSLLDPWIRLCARSVGANGSRSRQAFFAAGFGNMTAILNTGSF